MRAIKDTILAIGLAALATASSAASFECEKAKSKIEILICSSERLSKLDDQLNASYKAAMSRLSDKGALRSIQREWLSSYEVTSCRNATCLEKVFAERISLLGDVAPTNDEANLWTGQYDRYWKGKKDKDTATISLVPLSGNRIYIVGSALWHGANWKTGQINTGEINGIGDVRDSKAVFDIDGCQGELELKDNAVIVSNESGCGGLNVSFNGEYKKRGAQ